MTPPNDYDTTCGGCVSGVDPFHKHDAPKCGFCGAIEGITSHSGGCQEPASAAACICPHKNGLPAIACCAVEAGCCCSTPPPGQQDHTSNSAAPDELPPSTCPHCRGKGTLPGRNWVAQGYIEPNCWHCNGQGGIVPPTQPGWAK